MQIYIAEGTQHTGPFDLDAIKEGLRAGRYQPDQLAWYEGAPGWEPIRRLPGMEGFFVSPPVASPPPPPAPAPTLPQAPAPYNVPPGYQTPLTSAPTYYAPANAGPARRPWWPVVAGIVVALGILAGGFAMLRRGSDASRSASGSPAPSVAATTVPSAVTTPAATPKTPQAAPPAALAANTRHYVANRARYSGESAAHFVAFSFDYPSDWEIDEAVKDEFVEARHYIRSPDGKNVLTESVSFSYAYSRPGYALAANLPAAGSQLLEMAANSTLGRLPEATKTAPRSGRFGRYPSQEHSITSPANDEDPGLYFRQAIVANPQSSGIDGLFVTMLASDFSGNTSAESLGKTGGLHTIQETFRFEP